MCSEDGGGNGVEEKLDADYRLAIAAREEPEVEGGGDGGGGWMQRGSCVDEKGNTVERGRDCG